MPEAAPAQIKAVVSKPFVLRSGHSVCYRQISLLAGSRSGVVELSSCHLHLGTMEPISSKPSKLYAFTESNLKGHVYRAPGKSMYFLLSRTQAEQLSKSRKKLLASTYKHFPGALYRRFSRSECYDINISGSDSEQGSLTGIDHLQIAVFWPKLTHFDQNLKSNMLLF